MVDTAINPTKFENGSKLDQQIAQAREVLADLSSTIAWADVRKELGLED